MLPGAISTPDAHTSNNQHATQENSVETPAAAAAVAGQHYSLFSLLVVERNFKQAIYCTSLCNFLYFLFTEKKKWHSSLWMVSLLSVSSSSLPVYWHAGNVYWISPLACCRSPGNAPYNSYITKSYTQSHTCGARKKFNQQLFHWWLSAGTHSWLQGKIDPKPSLCITWSSQLLQAEMKSMA